MRGGKRWLSTLATLAAALVSAVSGLPGAALAGQPGSPAAPAPGPAADDESERVAAYLRRHMADLRIPGFAYAIVRGDRVISQGAWGSDGDGAPVTPDTPFVLGSLSKSFTALAVSQLVAAGRVELDAPARRYLPWLKLADEATAARITVRELLTHTTGLPQVAALGLTDRYDNSPDGLARSVRDLAAIGPTGPTGVHQYSDANYMILGALVEEVTGQPFGAYLRQHVLDPLGMSHSAATEAEARAVRVPAGHRYYLRRPWRFDPPFDTSGVSYGFLAASLTDLTHYAIAQLNDGRYGDRTVLSAAGIAQAHTGQAPVGTSGQRYGLGWRDSRLDGPRGPRVVWHAGATANYFSHLVLVPESELAVVVLSNVYGLAMDPPLASAAFNVVRILHGGQPVAASADPLLTGALIGTLAVAGLLLVVLSWSVVRAVRRGRRPVARSVRRTVLGALAWAVGCAAGSVGAVWVVPATWQGATLRQVLLFAPDIGHALIAVAVLAGLIGLVRLGAAARALWPTRPGTGPTPAGDELVSSAAPASREV